MKFTKRLLTLLFVFSLFVLGFAFTSKVNAGTVATSDKISVVGASIRTTGNAGLRFVGTVGDYDTTNVKAYGIAIAYGTVEPTFVIGDTVNGASVLYAEDTAGPDKDGKFYVVIYGIPQNQYNQAVTARAYVVLNDDSIVYGTTSTARSIYQVAKAASEDPNYTANEFVSGIVTNSEFTAIFYPNGGTLSGEGLVKYYPAATQTLTAGYYGTAGYWQAQYQTSVVFVVSKAQFDADSSNSYAYTYRVGFTKDTGIDEYKVDQILTGSGSGVVNIHTCNTSDYYLMVNTGYTAGKTALQSFAVGDVVTIEGGFAALTTGAISKTINRYSNYQLAYSKEVLVGDTNLPTPTKSLNDFVKWVDGSDNTVTSITGNVSLYAVWEPAFEMRYYSNGGTLTGDYNRSTYYELGEDAIAEDDFAMSAGGYYTYYKTNLCFYTQAGASDGFTYARKIGLNYNSDLQAYEIVQNIAGGTAFNSDNRTSQYYILIGDDYTAGKNWGAGLQVGKYLVFGTNVTGLSGANNNVNIKVYSKVAKEICVKKDSGLITLPIPTRAAYAFDGWYENADFSGSSITNYNLTEGYKCVYAKWHKIAYTGNVVTNNGLNSTGSYNSLSNNGLTVTYSAIGSSGAGTAANGYVAFRCYEDGVEMSMGPSKWTISTSNDSVISAYSAYSCVGLVKGAGTCTITLTNKANTDIVIKINITVVNGAA